MRVADYPFHSWHFGQIVGGALRIAASDENSGSRVFTMDSSNSRACVIIGRGGHRAGIKNNNIGGGAIRNRGQAAGREQDVESSAIGLSGAAAKVLHEECGLGGQAPIVAGTEVHNRNNANDDDRRSGG